MAARLIRGSYPKGDQHSGKIGSVMIEQSGVAAAGGMLAEPLVSPSFESHLLGPRPDIIYHYTTHSGLLGIIDLPLRLKQGGLLRS